MKLKKGCDAKGKVQLEWLFAGLIVTYVFLGLSYLVYSECRWFFSRFTDVFFLSVIVIGLSAGLIVGILMIINAFRRSLG